MIITNSLIIWACVLLLQENLHYAFPQYPSKWFWKQCRLWEIFDDGEARIECGGMRHNQPRDATIHVTALKVPGNHKEGKNECVWDYRKTYCPHSRGQIQVHTYIYRWDTIIGIPKLWPNFKWDKNHEYVKWGFSID